MEIGFPAVDVSIKSVNEHLFGKPNTYHTFSTCTNSLREVKSESPRSEWEFPVEGFCFLKWP